MVLLGRVLCMQISQNLNIKCKFSVLTLLLLGLQISMKSKVQLIDFLSPLRHLKLVGGVFFTAFHVNALLLLVNVKIPFICRILNKTSY